MLHLTRWLALPIGSVVSPLNQVFSAGVTWLEKTLFFSIGGLPLVIWWLLLGATFFTVRLGFINVRGFKHGLAVMLGCYDEAHQPGDVNQFQAMATALSATVGLGNIAGVAIAIQLGGPGAVFWMSLVGFLGMSSKFVECTLAQKYRQIRPDGSVAGGPMYYLSQGLATLGLKSLGQGLGVMFAVACAIGALGGGNMFQANQFYAAIAYLAPAVENYRWLYGLALSGLVGLVIIGGIRRIGAVASAIVPTMAGIYVLASVGVLMVHWADIPPAIGLIVQEAFQPRAVGGGMVVAIIHGVRRALFSNGAGVGSAAIAHAAARTQEPVREGIVASLEPFIDTLVLCNLTALVCITTGAYQTVPNDTLGFALVAQAFGSVVEGFPVLLTVTLSLFAFSTIISWCYYGEQCWRYLMGDRGILGYRLTLVSATFIGSVTQLGPILAFSDMMLFVIAVPNLLGCVLLSGQVAQDLQAYWQRLQPQPASPQWLTALWEAPVQSVQLPALSSLRPENIAAKLPLFRYPDRDSGLF